MASHTKHPEAVQTYLYKIRVYEWPTTDNLHAKTKLQLHFLHSNEYGKTSQHRGRVVKAPCL